MPKRYRALRVPSCICELVRILKVEPPEVHIYTSKANYHNSNIRTWVEVTTVLKIVTLGELLEFL